MIKYATDGIHNDLQYEEMYDMSSESTTTATDEDSPSMTIDDYTEEDMIETYEQDLEYEIMVYTNSNTKGMIIYSDSIFGIEE